MSNSGEHHDRSILTGNDPSTQARRMALFGRHFVCLIAQVQDEKGASQPPLIASAFLIELAGDCYVVTAGHVIDGMMPAVKAGWTFTNFSAMDTFGGGPYREAVPLGVGRDSFIAAYSEESGIDLALAPLSQHIVLTLAANNSVPVPATADIVQLAVDPYDALMLAGIPNEFVESRTDSRGRRLDVTLACLRMESISPEDASSVFADCKSERIYGLLGEDVKDQLSSIVGMSGGPVFGLWYSEDGSQFRYTVIGVQSKWDRGRQVAAWPLGRIIGLSVGIAEARANDAKDG